MGVCEPLMASEDQLDYLKKIEKATFNGFSALIDSETEFPVDIGRIVGDGIKIDYHNDYSSKTSPTNIGFGFLHLILAQQRGVLTEKEALSRGIVLFSKLKQLETYRGFLFNWYYVSGKKGKIPQVTLSQFVSSLDNGILDICLAITSQMYSGTLFASEIEAYLSDKDYTFFFQEKDNQFRLNLGWDTREKRYSDSDYLILNTEARMVLLYAILKENLSEAIWKDQSRLVREYETKENERIKVVAPWGGSLYETLLADEFIAGDEKAPNAFRVNAINMIRIHKDRGKKLSRQGIWGFSNGEVPNKNRYEMAGVPEIAYNQFPSEFVTIYSTFLALKYDLPGSVQNLRQIQQLNSNVFNPNYGFSDSINPVTKEINRNILALDKGMELLAISNLLSVMNGQKTISNYFWDYLTQKGWAQKAATFLAEEQDHLSFQSIRKDVKEEALVQSSNGITIDLLREHKKVDVFQESGRALFNYEIITPKDIASYLDIYYDVHRRYSYGGVYIIPNLMEGPNYKQLDFQIRGFSNKGFPKLLKLELKSNGQYLYLKHIKVTPAWQKISISFPDPIYQNFDIAFVIENQNAERFPKGKVRIRHLKLIS